MLHRFGPPSLLVLAASAAASGEPIDTITVEATKRPAQSAEIAGSVTVIDSDRIERELAQSIDDLVRYEPGVDVGRQGSRFGLAGFSIRGVGGNRVLIEVDGVAAPDAFSIGAFSNASRDLLDVSGLKQVEIVRGPASALFGSDALGGVVSLVTLGPADYLDDRDRHVDLSVGYNSVDASEVLTGTLAQRVGPLSGMLKVTQRRGNELDVDGVDPMNDDSINLLGKLLLGNADQGGLTLGIERFRADTVTDVDSLETTQDLSDLFGIPYVVDTTLLRGDDRRQRLRITATQQWQSGVLGMDYLRWRLYHQESETSQETFEQRSTLIGGRPGAVDRLRHFVFDQQLAGAELNATRAFNWAGIEQSLSWGLEVERSETTQLRTGLARDRVTGATSTTVGPDTFPVRDFPPSTLRRAGAYLQHELWIGPLALIPALRYDRFDIEPSPDPIFAADNPGYSPATLTEDQVSPKFGLQWSLSDRWTLNAQYARGFRAPPVNDVNIGFSNFQFGYTAIPNPELRAESSEGLELGARFSGDTLQFRLALFETRYDDFIQSLQVVDFDPINQLLVFQSRNLDAVRIHGAEAVLRWAPSRWPSGLSLNASAAWADGEDRNSGLPINSVAPLNGVLGIDYRPPHGRWGGSLSSRFSAGSGARDETDGALLRTAGYAVVDLLGFWSPSSRLRLRGGVYNLGDRSYTDALDVQAVPIDTLDPRRLQRPGRHISVAIDWTF